MKPEIALVTATDARPDRMGYTAELYRGLLTSTVDWQWSVCVDGADPDALPAELHADSRVHVETLDRSFGAAAARNVALATVTAPWVTSTDDDDLLPAGSLERRLEAARADRTVRWVGGLLADLHLDGSQQTWDCPCPRGRLRPGEVWRAWAAPEATIPLGPTTLLVATDLMRAVGGWQGLPQGEDLGMVSAVTAAAPGFMLDEVVYLYRKHAGQMMRSARFDRLEPLVRRATWDRGRILTGLVSETTPA